jgi:hypothetical protein
LSAVRIFVLRRFFSNASANVFSGAAAAGYQLTVAGIGSRTWQGDDFAAWALALSVTAIAPVFTVSLSSVITRRIVEARHSKASSSEFDIVAAGRRVGQHLSYFAILLLFFSGSWIQAELGSDLKGFISFLALLFILLMTNMWLFLWQTRFGQYYADERNWMPTLVLMGARLGGVLGMVGALSASGPSLLAAALGLCAGTWAGLIGAKLLLPPPGATDLQNHTPAASAVRLQYRLTARLLSGFAVGSVSMLAVQYGIPPLMALIAPSLFNAFYLASILNMVAVGILAAATSSMLAPLTRWRSRGETPVLRRFAVLSPIVCAFSGLIVLSISWYSLGYIHSAISVRAASLDDIRSFLALLGLQTIIRSAAAGYAMYIASSGTPQQVAAPLVIEIALTITIAIPLALISGPKALLYGLVLSGLLGSLYSSRVLASLPQTSQIGLRVALPSLFAAQVGTSAIWLLIVKYSL